MVVVEPPVTVEARKVPSMRSAASCRMAVKVEVAILLVLEGSRAMRFFYGRTFAVLYAVAVFAIALFLIWWLSAALDPSLTAPRA
jgi:hypothetical protein